MALVPDRLEKAKKVEADLQKRKNYIKTLIDNPENKSEDKDLIEYNNMTKEQLENSLKDFD